MRLDGHPSTSISRHAVADRVAAYLHHEITLSQPVNRMENVTPDTEFSDQDTPVLRDVIARLGVADRKALGVTWEDCESFLNRLGYTAHVQVVAG